MAVNVTDMIVSTAEDGVVAETTSIKDPNLDMAQSGVNNVLLEIISRFSGATYAGVATPETDPGTPLLKVFYLTTTAGEYANFGNITVESGKLTVLLFNGSTWEKQVLDLPTSGGGSTVTVVQTTGTSTTDVMSQKSVTDELGKRQMAPATAGQVGQVLTQTGPNAEDVSWQTPSGGGGTSVTVVQTTGTSTTDVMSQKSVTDQAGFLAIEEFSNTKTYEIGDFVLYGGLVKRFISAHEVGEWNDTEVKDSSLYEYIMLGKSTFQYNVDFENNGYIKNNGAVAISGSWKHTGFINVDDFVQSKSNGNATVAQLAYYSESSYDAFLGYETFGFTTITPSKINPPEGTRYIVFSGEFGKGFDPIVVTKKTYESINKRFEEVGSNLQSQSAKISEVETQLDNISVNPKISPRMIHISFDDTIYALYQLSIEEYASLFDSPFFGYLKELHDTYGCVFSCYCFIKNLDTDKSTVLYSLSDVPDTYSDEFTAASSWLRFGFHSRDNYTLYNTASAEIGKTDYNEFITEILRITGSVKCIDLCVRLSSFTGSLEAVTAMRDAKCGIIGLLSSDYSETGETPNIDTSTGYYLTNPYTHMVANKGRWFDVENQIFFFPSNLRLDNIPSSGITSYLDKNLTLERWSRANNIILYCHENQAYKDGVWNDIYKTRLNLCGKWAVENNYRFVFPMDKIRTVY